jgi:hypothetical protein
VDDEALNRYRESTTNSFSFAAWLNERRDFDTASRLIPITDDLTHPVAELSVKRK